MSATCDKCYYRHMANSVTLCPLHAEAEAMKDLLRDLVRFADAPAQGQTVESEAALVSQALYSLAFRARLILAIDGDTPDA